VLADLYTYLEHRGAIEGRTVAWIGDGNNMCNTWIQAAVTFGFKLNVCTPAEYGVATARLAGVGREVVEIFTAPAQAVRGADLVTTDVWTSMGFEAENEARLRAFAGFMVDASLMRLAKPDALFMHCLPAHRGEEVAADVVDGPQSVVWEEAENRLHVQKALMEYLLLGKIDT
jgi:ornithine carbamoyltransferase